MDTRPIANKYSEGKMQRTLKRELKVRETVEREADETTAGLEANLLFSLGGGTRVGSPHAHLHGYLSWSSNPIFEAVCVVSRAAVAVGSVSTLRGV